MPGGFSRFVQVDNNGAVRFSDGFYVRNTPGLHFIKKKHDEQDKEISDMRRQSGRGAYQLYV